MSAIGPALGQILSDPVRHFDIYRIAYQEPSPALTEYASAYFVSSFLKVGPMSREALQSLRVGYVRRDHPKIRQQDRRRRGNANRRAALQGWDAVVSPPKTSSAFCPIEPMSDLGYRLS
jgi:hypothetical protein